MKIAVFSLSYPPLVSGVATISHALATNLAKKNSLSVFTSNQKFKMEVVKKNHLTEYRLPAIKAPVLRKDVYIPTPNLLKVISTLNDLKPDLIHVHDPGYLSRIALIASIQLNIPIVATHHFIPKFISSYFRAILKTEGIVTAFENQIWKSVIKFYNQLDYVTVPSTTFKNILIKNHVHTPIAVISNGVDLDKFTPTKPVVKKPHLLYLGRLDQDKNLPILLKAFSQVKNQKLQLVLAGEGNQKQELIKLSHQLNINHRCQFLGFIPEAKLAQIYQQSLAFIITSTVEAQSISTLQAIASGLPIIGANAAALPELIRHQHNGLLIAPHRSKQIAIAIDLLSTDHKLRQTFSLNSLKLAQNHNIQSTFKQYSDLFQSLIVT